MDDITLREAKKLLADYRDDVIIAAAYLALGGSVEENPTLEERARTYTIDELCRMWRCSNTFIYEAIHKGKLQAMKVGRSWKIPDSARREFEKGLLTNRRSRQTWVPSRAYRRNA